MHIGIVTHQKSSFSHLTIAYIEALKQYIQ
jgi:hypothetical protein